MRRLILGVVVVAGAVALSANAELALTSEESAFGADTISYDADTGLQWLDVPLSAPYNYDEIETETGPGGVFEGYRLATEAEVVELWQNAGISGPGGEWNEQDLDPILMLMGFVGVTSNTGNRDGNFFDYTAGAIQNDPDADRNTILTIAADPDHPVLAEGKSSKGTVPRPTDHSGHGAWLVVVPEPSLPFLTLAALMTLAGLRRLH